MNLKSNNINIPAEVLSSYARSLLPEIEKFYNSEEGKAYYDEWLKSNTIIQINDSIDF